MNRCRVIWFLPLSVALAVGCGESNTSNKSGTADGGGTGLGTGTGSNASTASGAGTDTGTANSTGSGVVAEINEAGVAIVTNVECPAGAMPPAVCQVGESCCATTAISDAGGRPMTTYGCVDSVASCGGGQVTSCTSSLQCQTAQVCCSEPVGDAGGLARNQLCEATCPTGATQLCSTSSECGSGMECSGAGQCRVPPCTGSASCTAGQVCCQGGGRNGAACQAMCPMGSAQVCQATTECPTGQKCMAGGGGGAMTCVVPPCTPGSCGAGMVCCSTGGGTCETGTTCTMGAQLCTTTADCPAGGGLVCRAGGGGGGGGAVMECRAPLPEAGAPGDAGMATDAATPQDAAGGG